MEHKILINYINSIPSDHISLSCQIHLLLSTFVDFEIDINPFQWICIFRIFGFEDDNADDIIYINWLNMARAGLLALEFYSPESFKWRQAHMNARFVILRVMLEAGEGLVTIRKTVHEDGKEDILLTLDRSKIIPVGKPAIGNFLRKLQVG